MSYMKAEFDKILKEYGHDVYLQKRIRSTGHDDGGWDPTFQIHTVRYKAGGLDVLQSLEEGLLSGSERIYYFRTEAGPFDGDRIYEDDPRVDQTVWVIDATVPMRGEGGDIEYYAAGASRIRPN